MNRCVIDTNVPVVANGPSARDAGPGTVALSCRIAAIEFLKRVLASGKVVLDVEGEVQAEYHRYLNPRGQPGTGDRFYLEVLNSQPERVERVALPKRADGAYADCPEALIEAGFDPSDRKFAALAKKTGSPVYNATDSDWARHLPALERARIDIRFLCGCDPAKWFEAAQPTPAVPAQSRSPARRGRRRVSRV